MGRPQPGDPDPTEVVMSEAFQLTVDQAEAYEELFVPALFAQWAPQLLDTANVSPGQRVLDVACGTGVVARAAADTVGEADAGRWCRSERRHARGCEACPAGRHSVAQRRCGRLPFDDGSFDAVLCQSALFFFPDPVAAIREMSRVAKTGGTVAAADVREPRCAADVRPVCRHRPQARRSGGQEAL